MRIDLNLKRRGERELWIQRGNGRGRIDWRKIRYHLLHSVRLLLRTGTMGKDEEEEEVLGGMKMEITMLELLVQITMIDITIRMKMMKRTFMEMGMEMEKKAKEIQVSLRSKGINYRFLLHNLLTIVKIRGYQTLSFLLHLLQVKEVTRITVRDPFTLLANIN